MLAYKIFQREKGALISSGYIPESLKQEYFEGKENFPKFGKGMFIFTDINIARRHVKEHDKKGLELWEVEVQTLVPVNEIPRVWLWTEDYALRTIDSAWSQFDGEKFTNIRDCAGSWENCHMTPSLTLVKQIQ